MPTTNFVDDHGRQWIELKDGWRMSLAQSQSHGALPQESQNEFLFKILVVGDVGTGKTSIIRRYVMNFFNQYYKATIGVDFALKVLVWDVNTIVRLQLWDISGQDRFGNITRVYYKEAAGALVVFDAARAATYGGALRWKADLDEKVRLADGSTIPTVLIANKNTITDEQLHKWSTENNFLAGYRTSAKDNINIDEAFHTLAAQVIAIKKAGQYEIPAYQKDGNIRRLTMSGPVETDRHGRMRTTDSPKHYWSCC